MSVKVISDELLKDLNDGKVIDIDLGMGIGFSMASEAWARQQDEYWDKTWGSGKKPESTPVKSVDEIINDIYELKVVSDLEKHIHKKGYFDAINDLRKFVKEAKLGRRNPSISPDVLLHLCDVMEEGYEKHKKSEEQNEQ